MITKFSTPAISTPATAPSGKSSNTLLYVLIGGVLLYLGWKYLIKPKQDKVSQADGSQNLKEVQNNDEHTNNN